MIENCTHFNTYYYTVHLTTTVVRDNDQCSLRINGNIVYTVHHDIMGYICYLCYYVYHGLVFRRYRVCDKQMRVKLIHFNTGSYCVFPLNIENIIVGRYFMDNSEGTTTLKPNNLDHSHIKVTEESGTLIQRDIRRTVPN